MSDPTAPREPGDPGAAGAPPPVPPLPTEPLGTSQDAQPTEAYPPASPDAQPTRAYPAAPASDADAQPTLAYAPAAHPGAQQSYSGQPGYGAAQPAYNPAYAPPPYDVTPQRPVITDTRPRTLAIAALVAAGLGLLLSLGGFIPIAGLATVLVVIGGVLLLIAFILSLVVLISKAQGGKPLGIAALIVSILGGTLFSIAFFVSLVWIGLANAASQNAGIPVAPESTSTAVPSEEASDEPSESAEPEASGTYDEAAYLAAVRPEITALMQEIQPGITEEQLSSVYTDDALITIGQSFVTLASVGGVEAGREQLVDLMVDSSNGQITEEQASRFFETIGTAAQQYLVR